ESHESALMPDALIIDAVRTPIGKHRGVLKDVRPDDLAAVAIQAIVSRSGLASDRIEEVFLGCANQAGEDNRNVARMAGLLAGLPHSVPAVTVNRLCGSGLEAGIQAARMLRLGEADGGVAGGEAQAGRRFPHREMGAVRHFAGLAFSQSSTGGAVPARADGRDRRERGRALANLTGRAGPVRARLSSEGGRGPETGPLPR